ncbi:MAG TPA: RNA polymerase sigma factor [Phycisphaerae bacterium]|nr:RNA polymerase sigma factor [Phycisphaerae bacterium]
MTDHRSEADVLMARGADGDAQAFARLAELTAEAVYRFALAHLPPGLRNEAEDVRQETYLRGWRRRKAFRKGGRALGWLLGIALNVVREQRRRRRHLPLPDAFRLAGPDPPGPDDRIGRLARALEALPDRQREAVACRFLRGMSVAETARAMGCAEGTVKATVFKAVANLQRIMSEAP